MKHKDKVKKARKMISKKEKEDGVNIFDSQAWNNHKEAIKRKVKKREEHFKRLSATKRNII